MISFISEMSNIYDVLNQKIKKFRVNKLKILVIKLIMFIMIKFSIDKNF